jgi:hypothetical protein
VNGQDAGRQDQTNQSQGRKDNAATPLDEEPGTASVTPEDYPAGPPGEGRSFGRGQTNPQPRQGAGDSGPPPSVNEGRLGPGADPAEGKR